MSQFVVIDAEMLAAVAAADGEFRLASKSWTGGVRFIGETFELGLTIANGVPLAANPGDGPEVISITGTDKLWSTLLAPIAPRLENDLWPLIAREQLALKADFVMYGQYFAALARLVELIRPESPKPQVPEVSRHGQIDTPIGRYIHLDLNGHDHRVYFEEAGSGIPLIVQHTAGCHGSQWRHLFESKAVTDHFRVIAYDLPFHGKSLPPEGARWWTDQYKLQGGFFQSVPVSLARALGLERPVFMGVSVGGSLALELARYYPEEFRAVISVEGSLKTYMPIDHPTVSTMWDPRVSSDYKARMMDGLMSPTSPEAYRKEVSYMYSGGYPQTFIGDLNYYCEDYDMREEARNIDTSKCAVHIMNGEYDYFGTLEAGQQAHAEIAGSTWVGMDGIGHFPMSENPEKFLKYVLPILQSVRDASVAPRVMVAA